MSRHAPYGAKKPASLRPRFSCFSHHGAGTGRHYEFFKYPHVSDAMVTWTFVDAGEPGHGKDIAEIRIYDANDNIVLDITGTLKRGNNQTRKHW
jgi:hypothetical protein